MRVVQNKQMEIGEIDISKIEFNHKERNGITRFLMGAQHLYTNLPTRKTLFDLLETKLLPNTDKNNGRPGMALWSIFLCGSLRLDLNMSYDALLNTVNNHKQVREMLGHGELDAKYEYELQTLMDNVKHFTPELLDAISDITVKCGHTLLAVENEVLKGRGDSWVCKTNVHFPTDISLLYDAMRKIITLIAKWCASHGDTEWRQYKHNIRSIKRLFRAAQNRKHRKDKSEGQQVRNAVAAKKANQEYADAYLAYLNACEGNLAKARETVAKLEALEGPGPFQRNKRIEEFVGHAVRQIDQTYRRALKDEVIPHALKVFSLFKPYTEWIVKGKAGVAVELGLRVCIIEDQYRFIIRHMVMDNKTDDKVAVLMVRETKRRFPNFDQCSYDKGFHSKENQSELKEEIKTVVLPRKGKLSKAAKAEEQTEEFKAARRAHSAVESAINALQVHGLEMCPDYGIDGFKRYVAFAVLARNIHRLGDILWEQAEERKRKEKVVAANSPQYRQVA